MTNTAQKDAMDRAGEIPLERRKAERRSNADIIGKMQADLDAYESLCQGKDATIAALNQQLAAARNEALEEAAARCIELITEHQVHSNFICAKAIRALASHPAAPVQPQVPLIGVLLDAFSELETLWGLNEPGALVRHSDVFRMLVKAGKEQKAAQAAPDQQTGDVRDPLAEFTAYVVKNYPADTIIGDPAWHAPRLFRAAQQALAASGGALAVPEDIARDAARYAVLKRYITPRHLSDSLNVKWVNLRSDEDICDRIDSLCDMAIAAAPTTQDQGGGK